MLAAFVLTMSTATVHAVSPNLAVDLVSTNFSDTSVQATASGPSGTGSVVLQNNPGNLAGFDVTVSPSGGSVAFTGSSINPGLCTTSEVVLINMVTPFSVRFAVACLGGGILNSGDLNLFQFGWSGSSGTVNITSDQLANSAGAAVSATTSGGTVRTVSAVPEFPLGFALLFGVMVPVMILLRNVRTRKPSLSV